MDGDSKPHFRGNRNDFPQDTQLFSGYLSHHHRHIGDYRVLQQVKKTPAKPEEGRKRWILEMLSAQINPQS